MAVGAARPARPAMPRAWSAEIERAPWLAALAELYLDEYELVNLLRWRQLCLRVAEYEAWGLPVEGPEAVAGVLARLV